MGMRISTRGFQEAIDRLNEMSLVAETQKFQDVLVGALRPIADQAKANVHGVTGRTVQAITVSPGKNLKFPSAFIKVDKKIASAPYRGKPFPYPYAVEALHPFFRPAVLAGRASARRIVRDGIEDVLNPYHTTMSVGGEFS